MACKWIGPGWFIPAISLGFGIASLGTAFVNDFSSACGVRFILGVFEAPMFPGIAYYLSRWYRRSELVFRLSLYVVMGPLAGAFGGLIASGILTLDSIGSVTRWRMIFLVEGILTCVVSIIAFFTLTDRPETARWLTQDEKDIAIARILRGVASPVTLMIAFIFCHVNITVQGLGFFAPTIIRTIYPTNSVVSQQLHTVPPYAVGAVFTLLFPFLSWRLDRRNLFFLICAPLVMIGYIMFLATTEKDPMIRYGATFFITSGSFAFGALCNAQASANLVSDTARAAGIGTVVMVGNLGGLVSTWSYLYWDGPNFRIGNGLNLATSTTILFTTFVMVAYMRRDNQKRDVVDVNAKLAGLSPQQVEDLDWKHPGFRWRS